jgi:pilus assembly protein CpaC
LTAAGQTELARTVAAQALLEEIRAQIRQLQADVAQLRGTKTGTDQTVMLHVQIMELQVARMKELGFDLSTVDGVKSALLTGGAQVTVGAAHGLIETLRRKDLVKVLAEPTLVTVSGRPASFRSGGEFPILVPQSLGTQSIEFQQYGTRLDCVAKVLDSGRIHLELLATVSELDPSRTVKIQDTPVPGLRSRSVDTAVEMAAGETMILSGMRQARSQEADDSAPNDETSLLVAVTATVGASVQQAAAEGASTR